MMTKPALYQGFLAACLLGAAFGAAAVRAQPQAAPAGPVEVGPPPPVLADPEQAIVERQQAMKADGKIFKAMKAALAAGEDMRPFTQDAQWFVAWGKEMPAFFPPGSEHGHKTKAKPDIWTDKPGFDRFAQDMVAASERLVQAASTGNGAAFADDFHALGRACGGCHKRYAYPLH
jgi:cytochrome c556